jgi:hypothetical protein
MLKCGDVLLGEQPASLASSDFYDVATSKPSQGCRFCVRSVGRDAGVGFFSFRAWSGIGHVASREKNQSDIQHSHVSITKRKLKNIVIIIEFMVSKYCNHISFVDSTKDTFRYSTKITI